MPKEKKVVKNVVEKIVEKVTKTDPLISKLLKIADSLQIDNRKNFRQDQMLAIACRKSLVANGGMLREKLIEMEEKKLVINIGGPIWRKL